VQRWGDYAAVSLDPSPGVNPSCKANRRAYGINEKINAAVAPATTSTWGSRIFRFGFCN
jgi:hypothetical protein